MNSSVGSWGKELAKIWTNYLPPCRVSWSELSIYTKYLRLLQQRFGERDLKLLILGSTPEFRDWGHEERLEVTVVDYSKGYNIEIAKQMKYKNINEMFVNCKWQDIEFNNEFHFVVGDLVVGNLKQEEVPDFLKRISRSLIDEGMFITKSFFQQGRYNKGCLEEIFKDYYQRKPSGHPFANLIYKIAMNCVDQKTNMLHFSYIHRKIKDLYDQKVIDNEMFQIFSCLGWQENMKFGFYFPPKREWEYMAAVEFDIIARERSDDVYADDFLVYVLSSLNASGG